MVIRLIMEVREGTVHLDVKALEYIIHNTILTLSVEERDWGVGCVW